MTNENQPGIADRWWTVANDTAEDANPDPTRKDANS